MSINDLTCTPPNLGYGYPRGKIRMGSSQPTSPTTYIVMLLAIPVFLVACGSIIRKVGGDFAGPPDAIPAALSPAARNLVNAAFAGIEPGRLIDLHIHVFGQGTREDGPFVTPTVHSWLHPYRMLQYRVYLSASGITDESRLNEQYVERLASLLRGFPTGSRFFIYAMDRNYRADGSPDPDATPFYVPNDYIFELAGRHPDLLTPAVSIHPNRQDALQELEKWRNKGIRYVKWLPTSQGIDAADVRIEPFYRKMAEYGMVLLVHTGEELAVFSGERQELGNPLRLRLPLKLGVTVVALHSASFGKSLDLDDQEGGRVPSFELLMRLMDDPRYRDRLYGDLAGIAFFNHSLDALATLLGREDLHPRLINGSDYPLPAINFLVMTGRLERNGFITGEEREALNEIYRYNPLLFDFVLKRTLRHPETGRKFAPAAFTLPAEFPLP